MSTTFSVGELPFLGGNTVREYLDFVAGQYPDLAARLDFDRAGAAEALSGLPASDGIRFDCGQAPDLALRDSQRQGIPRAVGIRHLLSTAVGERGERPAILNIIGGDGLLARTAAQLGVSALIVTADVDEAKVVRALSQGLPAVRQDVTHLFVRSDSFDAVVAAYESHHIDLDARQAACVEAARALRSGGRLVMSDFAAGSPITTWFAEIVDPFTDTGHRHEHYTKDGFAELFVGAGLRDVHVNEVYDPILVPGKTAEQAVADLVRYLISIYRLADTNGQRLPDAAALEAWLCENMVVVGDDYLMTSPIKPVRSLAVVETDDGFTAQLPRLSLVAVGTKP